MPRLKNDLLELLVAASNGHLDKVKIETDSKTTCTVVAVSGGYPGDYTKGYEIKGLDIAGLDRQSWLKNITLPYKLIKSFSLDNESITVISKRLQQPLIITTNTVLRRVILATNINAFH